MMSLKGFGSLIFFAGLSFVCFAQNIAFDHLSVENGLSQNSVLAIGQDARGFMWFGTRYGLNRYDGQTVRVYKYEEANSRSISNNYILSLLCDSRQQLWIGTLNGLNKYDPGSGTFVRILPRPDLINAPENRINCIYEDRRGAIWVGTATGLDRLVDGARPALKEDSIPCNLPGIAGNDVQTIFGDRDGNLWVGTATGLKRLKDQNGRWQAETFEHRDDRPGSLSDNFVTAINEGPDGKMWIGTTNGGLNIYDPGTGNFSILSPAPGMSGLPSNNIRRIIADRKGRFLIGTLQGLCMADPLTRRIISYQHDPENKKSLSQNSIHSIFQDAAGSIWAGTYFGGVDVTYSYTTPFTVFQSSRYRSSITNNVVSSIAEDEKNNLYIGTEGGGLNYLDRRTGLVKAWKNNPADLHSLGSNLVKTVYRDREGNIWVGTHDGGLELFDPVSGRFQRFLYDQLKPETYVPEVPVILEDSRSRLWVGTQAGLRLFNKTGTKLEPYPDSVVTRRLKQEIAHTLLLDKKKNIWTGTTDGLFVFTEELRPLQLWPAGHRLQTAYINCLCEDRKGRIWVGLYYGGLICYDPKTRGILSWSQKDGLPNNNVVGILEDDKGYLWISTDNGLSRFDVVTRNFKTYTVSDGLAADAFNYNAFWKDSKGELFFGGYKGLTAFFPDSIETNDYIAPLVFTSLRLFNTPVGIDGPDHLLKEDIGLAKKIVFRHDQNVFTLDFALLNFTRSDKNKYRYRLEGFDKLWNEVSTSSATYTNLPAGDYTFRVMGANNDGIWSQAAVLEIRILPPFWATWWAYLLYILILTVIVFFITRFFFLRALLRRDHELHQVKLNFFTNISHEIRTHLTLISSPVEKMLQWKKAEPVFHQQLQFVKTNADRLLRLVEELMEFRRAETNHLNLHLATEDIVVFIKAITDSFRELAEARGMHFGFTTPAEKIEVSFDKTQMEKVIFNLLTNAFKFTSDGGRIDVELETKGQAVEIRVTDNGKGIAPENVKKLFVNFFQVDDRDKDKQNTGYGIGLALSRSIVKLHKGDLTVESEVSGTAAGNRTCFTISLPLPVRSRPPAPVITGKEQAGRYSLLLVEDNAELRSFISDSLSGDYQVTTCADGGEGWETAIEQIPDIVISDVMMPGIDGLTLCSRLKTDQRTSHIPVILLTAKAAHEHQVSGLATGADIYLVKPFSIQILELHIYNLLAAREVLRKKFAPRIVLQPLTEAPGIEDEFLQKITRFIEENTDNPEFAVPYLSASLGMSQPVLYKKVKAVTNLSVNDFIKFIRLQKAAQLVEAGQLSVQQVAAAVGFTDSKYFSKEFKKQFGVTPSDYAKNRSVI